MSSDVPVHTLKDKLSRYVISNVGPSRPVRETRLERTVMKLKLELELGSQANLV
jgi:hypothetical protein